MRWWPFTVIRKKDLWLLRLQNSALRDALGNALAELRKHRALIASLKSGEPEVTRARFSSDRHVTTNLRRSAP